MTPRERIARAVALLDVEGDTYAVADAAIREVCAIIEKAALGWNGEWTGSCDSLARGALLGLRKHLLTDVPLSAAATRMADARLRADLAEVAGDPASPEASQGAAGPLFAPAQEASCE